MKKTISILIAIATVFSFTGCRNNKGTDASVFYYTYSDTYISNVRSSLGKNLNNEKISYQDYDSNGNQTTQTEQVQTAITKGSKTLVVNLVNTGSDDAAQGIISLAKNSNIPLIFFNREVSDEAVNSYDNCVFVGTDAKEAGHMQGEMIGEYILKNYEKIDLNKDGKISYILFKGEEGNNEAIYRTQYSIEDADKILEAAGKNKLEFYDSSNPNKYLVDKNGQWSAAAANEYMTTALASYNESNKNMIELVICNNDGMAEGAITALNSVGFNTGGDKKIPVFGVDATDAAKELIKNNKMTGTIKQDAEGMAMAISHLLKNCLNGKNIMENTGSFQVDKGVRKIRIPYSKFLGE
ncbi:MAG: galactose ABC transporter substrate-binding protein [Clostridia bacterium]|nr:galactose ABC transporter substrate-binding protein [Clostridia bacterium]